MKIDIDKIIKWLAGWLVFLLPYQGLFIAREIFWAGAKWQYGSIVFYATEIILVFLLVLLIIDFVRQRPKLSERKNVFLGMLIVAFIIFSAFSMWWSDDVALAFYRWHFLFLAGVLFLAAQRVPKNFLLSCLLWSGIIQAVVAIVQFTGQKVGGSTILGMASQDPGTLGVAVVGTSGGRFLRAYGTLSHPNMLGGFLAVALLTGIYLSVFGRHRIVALSGSLIITAGLFLTFSRGAWLGAGVGLLLFVFLIIKNNNLPVKKKLFTSVGAVLALVILLSVICWPLLATRVAVNGRLEVKSATERTASWQEAREVIEGNLLGGVGLGQYTVALSEKNPNQPAWFYQPAHNAFLLIAAELGVVGLLIFMMIIILIAQQAWRKNHYLLPLVVVLVIISLFDHYLWTSYFGVMLLWLGLFLVADGD